MFCLLQMPPFRLIKPSPKARQGSDKSKHLKQNYPCLQEPVPFRDKELPADINELYDSPSLSEKLHAHTPARGVLNLSGKEENIEVTHD